MDGCYLHCWIVSSGITYFQKCVCWLLFRFTIIAAQKHQWKKCPWMLLFKKWKKYLTHNCKFTQLTSFLKPLKKPNKLKPDTKNLLPNLTFKTDTNVTESLHFISLHFSIHINWTSHSAKEKQFRHYFLCSPRRNGTREVSHTAHIQYWGWLETPKQTNKNERQRFTKQTPPLNNYILRSWITTNRISDKRHQWWLSYWHWDQNWPCAENADMAIDWKAPSIFLIRSLPKISKGTWLEGFSKSTKHI